MPAVGGGGLWHKGEALSPLTGVAMPAGLQQQPSSLLILPSYRKAKLAWGEEERLEEVCGVHNNRGREIANPPPPHGPLFLLKGRPGLLFPLHRMEREGKKTHDRL